MNKPLKFILVIVLLFAGFYIYMLQKGHNLQSILNTPKKIELKAECSNFENLVITSSVNLTVTNLFTRTHNNVTVQVTAYDKDNGIVKQKNVVFENTLNPKSNVSKIVLLPAKAKRCECIVVDSTPI